MTSTETPVAPSGLILVVRLDSPDDAARAARAGIAGGFDAVEITFTVQDADRVIADLVAEFPGYPIGAGTVLEPEQVVLAAEAGATFVVAPDTYQPVAAKAAELGLAWIPGALTPTEIQTAHRMGAAAVKIFPVQSGGPRFLTELRGPLPHITYVASGGLDATSSAAVFAQGASAACVGVGFFGSALRDGSAEDLARIAGEFCAVARGGR